MKNHHHLSTDALSFYESLAVTLVCWRGMNDVLRATRQLCSKAVAP